MSKSRKTQRPLPPMPRVLVYLRVSSEMQVEEGYSLGMQEQAARDRCDEEFGPGKYRLEIERDEGISGSYGWEPPSPGSRRFRPGLARAAQKLAAGEVDVFMVYRVDRAFRNFFEQLKFRKQFLHENSGVRFISVTENVDLTRKEGVLVNDVLSLFGEYGREQLREIVADGMDKRRQDGYPTGTIGFGWRRTPKPPGGRPGLEPDPERAPWVRTVYDWYLSGWGTPTIVRELERRGAPRPLKAQTWSIIAVRALLKNPLHAGLIRDGDSFRQGVHWEQRIVERDEWEAVQREFARRGREPGKPFARGDYPLYGVARCGRCGGQITVVDNDGAAYRCRGSFQRGDVLSPDERELTAPIADVSGTTPSPPGAEREPGSNADQPWGSHWCGGWTRRAAVFDRQLLRLLSQCIRTPEFLRLADVETQALLLREGREKDLRQRDASAHTLQRLRQHREKLTRGYMANLVAEDDYERLYEELQEDISRTEAELREIQARLANQVAGENLLTAVRERLPRVSDIWEVLLPDERRQLLHELTEYIVLERLGGGRMVLRVKVPYLPELQSEAPHGKSCDGGFGQGVAGLTRRELAVIYLMAQGHTYFDVLTRWSVKGGQRTGLKKSILRRLDVDTLDQAVALAAGRARAERDRLPIDIPPGAPRESWRPSRVQRIPQVLERYLRGMTREEIVADLGLARHTVRMAEYNARTKYRVTTFAEALECFRKEREQTNTAPAGRKKTSSKNKV